MDAYICDECGCAEPIWQRDNEWLFVQLLGDAISLKTPRGPIPRREWHFCGADCLVKHFAKRNSVKKETESVS